MTDRIRSAPADRVASDPASAGTGNALSVPAFRYYWLNTLTFFLASNALRFVYGWVVLDGLERSEAVQGLVIFLLGLPALFLLLPAGVWADRLDPKKMLIGSQAAMLAVLVATALGVGGGAGTLGLVIASAVIAGIAGAVGQPLRQSMIPQLLPPTLLYSGIALNAIAMTVSMVLGAVSAQIAGELFGFDGAFWWLAGLVAVGLLILVPMESPGPAMTGDKVGMGAAVREGLAFVWGNRSIRALFGLLSISGLLMSPAMMVTSQAHVKDGIGRSAGDAGVVFALIGLGIAITSAYIMRRGNMPNKAELLMRAMFGGTSMVALMGFTTQFWQMLTLSFLLGLCGGFFINMNQGLIQANTPKPMMGRVMALFALVQVGLMPFGALLLGFLANARSTGTAMTAAGAAAFSLVLLTYTRSTSIRNID